MIKRTRKTRSKRHLRIARLFVPLAVIFIVASIFVWTKVSSTFLENHDKISNATQTGNPEEPDNNSREVVVVIDPGHGGKDLGTTYEGINEKDLVLDIALRLNELMKGTGIKAVSLRETDVFIDVKERAAMANNLVATLYISIHVNALPGMSEYKGTETLYCPSGNTLVPKKMDGKKLAQIVQGELLEALNTEDNGIIERPNLAVLRRTEMPAVIAEVGYLSNSEDRAMLADQENRQKAAEALQSAVVEALTEMGASKGQDGKWMIGSVG